MPASQELQAPENTQIEMLLCKMYIANYNTLKHYYFMLQRRFEVLVLVSIKILLSKCMGKLMETLSLHS